MKLSDDVGPRMILFKGFLFLFLLIATGAILLVKHFSWDNLFLVLVLTWSSARLYYFMFYVIEKYVDPEFKFSSVYACVLYLCDKKKRTQG